MKHEGVRYINQNGVLTDGVGVGVVGQKMAHTNNAITPNVTTAPMWGLNQEPSEIRHTMQDLEGVPTGSRRPVQTAYSAPVDFFADPSVLFAGPSSTGFTRISDQGISAGHHLPYELSWFLGGEESQASTTGYL